MLDEIQIETIRYLYSVIIKNNKEIVIIVKDFLKHLRSTMKCVNTNIHKCLCSASIFSGIYLIYYNIHISNIFIHLYMYVYSNNVVL